MTYTANKIRKELEMHDVCFIKFTKVDGTTRNMICTTQDCMIPRHRKPNGTMEYDMTRQVRVFDIVAQEWRSMVPDRVVEISAYGAAIAEEISG